MIQRRLVGQDGLALDQRGWGPDDIPQLVWPCALPEHLRNSTRPDQRILRAVVSMILVRMCTDAKDWVEAGATLGFPQQKSRNWTRYAFSSRWGLRGDLLAASHALGVKLTQPNCSSFNRRNPVRASAQGLFRTRKPPSVSIGVALGALATRSQVLRLRGAWINRGGWHDRSAGPHLVQGVVPDDAEAPAAQRSPQKRQSASRRCAWIWVSRSRGNATV